MASGMKRLLDINPYEQTCLWNPKKNLRSDVNGGLMSSYPEWGIVEPTIQKSIFFYKQSLHTKTFFPFRNLATPFSASLLAMDQMFHIPACLGDVQKEYVGTDARANT